jgi:hypothetical protein
VNDPTTKEQAEHLARAASDEAWCFERFNLPWYREDAKRLREEQRRLQALAAELPQGGPSHG